MTPYYQDSHCQIFLGDCREILPTLGPVDLVLTDPPYGLQSVAGSYGRHGATIANDETTELRDWLLEYWGDRPILVFSTPRLAEPPGEWDYRLIWDKAEAGLNAGPWRINHEPIFVRGAGWTRVDDGSFSILRYRTGNGAADRQDHPHRKPVRLLASLIRHAPPGTILDPFMGSGTTLVAAKQLNRKAIGIEIEERYCEIAAKRLAQSVIEFPSDAPEPVQLLIHPEGVL